MQCSQKMSQTVPPQEPVSSNLRRNDAGGLVNRFSMEGFQTPEQVPRPSGPLRSGWYTIIYMLYIINTSSTLQGDGGSFKNRKPIGEIGCCESWVAERIREWTESWLELCFLEWLQWSPENNNCWM